MKQSEIWLVRLDPSTGAEMKKIRPALIVSSNALGKLPIKIIAPITDWKERFADYPWMVKVLPSKQNGLKKESATDCFQIRSVSVERLTVEIGSVQPEVIAVVQKAVRRVLETGYVVYGRKSSIRFPGSAIIS